MSSKSNLNIHYFIKYLMEVEQLKEIRSKIDLLSNVEKEEIFKILKSSDCNFTKNNNGIFVNMNLLESGVLKKICQVIDYSFINKQIDDQRLNEVNNLKLKNA